MYCQCVKRIFDLTISILLLIFLFPFLIFLYLLVYFILGSPAIFTQMRPGQAEKQFRLYKFRTMRDLRDAHGSLLSDEQRLTKFGSLLRSLSLDELPALINVVKGEMSFVGPRPLLVEYLPYYSAHQKHRHDIRPGLTGWAQINGRNTVSWEKKFEMDVWYVNHCSFWLDCKIIFLTLFKVIRREGIHAEGQVTMTRFDLEQQQLSHHQK